MSNNQIIQNEIKKSIELLKLVEDTLTDKISEAANAIVISLKNGGKCMFFGNGGSAADSQHLAAEFMCRFKQTRKALAALALTTDSSFLTAFSNDFFYEDIFARQVEGLGKPIDIAFGITTSGSSENVIKGLEKAYSMGMKTVALLGANGEAIKNIVNYPIIVPSTDTPHVQECHIAIGHILCDIIEQRMFGEK
ncbi:SIS domain-containing protein [bacterium]